MTDTARAAARQRKGSNHALMPYCANSGVAFRGSRALARLLALAKAGPSPAGSAPCHLAKKPYRSRASGASWPRAWLKYGTTQPVWLAGVALQSVSVTVLPAPRACIACSVRVEAR
jgi:hypothetical protein